MSRARQIDAAAEYLGKESSLEIGEIGRGDVDIIDKPMPTDAIEVERFMSEPVTILVHESTDENDPDLVRVGVNGITQFIRRGTPQVVKRKYVERLARAKPTDFTQTIDDRLGEAMNHLKQRHGLKYPFSIIEDRNPNGSAWLRGVLAEAQ